LNIQALILGPESVLHKHSNKLAFYFIDLDTVHKEINTFLLNNFMQ